MASYNLFSNQADNQEGVGITWPGGAGIAYIAGTFEGGTVTLKVKAPDGSWIALTDGAFTSPTVANINLPSGTVIRAALTGVGSPSAAITVQLRTFA